MYKAKQVIVMRRDLKMRKGKIAAQAGHACVEAVLMALVRHGRLSDVRVENDWIRLADPAETSEQPTADAGSKADVAPDADKPMGPLAYLAMGMFGRGMMDDALAQRAAAVRPGASAPAAAAEQPAEDAAEKDAAESEVSPLQAWFDAGVAKICVYVDSEEELLGLAEAGRERGFVVALVRDAGYTEFHGEPTYTCLAFEPLFPEQIDPLTGKLPLY